MKITIISIILIFLVHHILVFLKTNLTTPKIKDLVYAPTQKYDAIFNAMNTNAMNTNAMNTNAMNTNAMNFDIQDQSSHKQNNIFYTLGINVSPKVFILSSFSIVFSKLLDFIFVNK